MNTPPSEGQRAPSHSHLLQCASQCETHVHGPERPCIFNLWMRNLRLGAVGVVYAGAQDPVSRKQQGRNLGVGWVGSRASFFTAVQSPLSTVVAAPYQGCVRPEHLQEVLLAQATDRTPSHKAA